MRSEEIHAVEMVRKIRDDIYEETKDLSDEELMRYFKERSRGVLSPGGEVGGKKRRERATA